MGRKKSYDREELIVRAVDLFRDHGFESTSTQMLVEALDVNRYSLYAEFGSKQELFDAALARYDREVAERNFGPLERPGAGLDEIRGLLTYFADAGDGRAAGRGCLLCNTAVEFGPRDPSGTQFVQMYFNRVYGAFLNALTNARQDGDLSDIVDPEESAHLFTAGVLGVFVLLRANARSDHIRGACAALEKHLDIIQPTRHT